MCAIHRRHLASYGENWLRRRLQVCICVPLSENMTSSTKPEVHKYIALLSEGDRATTTSNMYRKFRNRVVCEMCKRELTHVTHVTHDPWLTSYDHCLLSANLLHQQPMRYTLNSSWLIRYGWTKKKQKLKWTALSQHCVVTVQLSTDVSVLLMWMSSNLPQ